VYLKTGRFGPYVQRGVPDDEEKPQNASLLKGMSPADVDLATALKLLTLPRNLGDHPTERKPVMAYNGRFGPYVKCGEETRSLPADLSPLDVTIEQAVHLLAQPKTRGRGAAAKKPPLRVFDKPSPVTEKPVQVLDGRYGPYPDRRQSNVSLRKGMTVEELTFDEGAAPCWPTSWLKGPPPKAARKAAAPKKAAQKRPWRRGRHEKSARRKPSPNAKPSVRRASQATTLTTRTYFSALTSPSAIASAAALAAAVRDADVHLRDARAFEHLAGAAAEGDRRSAARFVPHLDVAPTDAADPAGAERLEHGFLRRPAAGVVLRGRLLVGAVGDLVVGVHATDEQLAVAVDHLRNPQALDDVGADADDLGGHSQ
jgi:hypothetical protein